MEEFGCGSSTLLGNPPSAPVSHTATPPRCSGLSPDRTLQVRQITPATSLQSLPEKLLNTRGKQAGSQFHPLDSGGAEKQTVPNTEERGQTLTEGMQPRQAARGEALSFGVISESILCRLVFYFEVSALHTSTNG